jgi:hypothetical protein
MKNTFYYPDKICTDFELWVFRIFLCFKAKIQKSFLNLCFNLIYFHCFPTFLFFSIFALTLKAKLFLSKL